MQYRDLHTHQASSGTDILAIVNQSFGHRYTENNLYSAGLHPWYLTEDEDWITQARAWLHTQLAQVPCSAVGECGLDKAINMPLDLQQAAFFTCIELAYEYQKPLILHCVRAFEELIQTKRWAEKKWGTSIAWIVHGFNKHPNLAATLLNEGFYLSFGTAILQSEHHAAQALRATPADRFFLETDADTQFGIKMVYDAAAKLRNHSLEAMQDLQAENWRRSGLA